MFKVKNVLVVYGGVSPEHEISIITALQVMGALKEAGFGVMPVYISKEGEWLLRKNLKVMLSPDRNGGLLAKGWLGYGGMELQPDVVFPVMHGKNGEDGTLQGLLELSGKPYVGCGVTASAIKIDKYLAKKIAGSMGLNVLKDKLVVKGEKFEDKGLKYPLFVKPVGLGSSIGLTRVTKKAELEEALGIAFCYDTRVMVEEAVEKAREINISILGNGPYEVSVTEQPKASSEILSFEDKYVSKEGRSRGMAGASRIIPAPFEAKILKQVQDDTIKLFREIGGKGIARCDFLIDQKDKVYFNELNTMPGSLAFYLWEKSNYPFPKLVTKLVELAMEEWQEKKKLVSTFESNVLANFSKGGLKGGKI